MATPTQLRRSLWVLVAAATLTVMAGAILGPVVPQIQSELGVSGIAAGLIITTHGGVIVLGSPIVGTLVDRIGPRQPFVGGLVVYGLGGGAGLFVDSYLPLLASRVLLGAGTAAVYTSVTVLIYQLYEGQQMERALGLRSGANSAGAAVWPLVGGAAGTVAWNLPFGVYLVALPLGLLAALTIPDVDATAAQVGGGGRTDSGDGLAGVLAVFRDQPVLPLVYLLYFGTNVLIYVIVVYYPQFLGGVGVTSSLQISFYLGANGAAGGVTAAVYDRLVQRVERVTLVLGALVLWSVALLSTLAVETPLGAAVPVVLFGLGIGLAFPSSFAWVEKFAPEDRQGQYSAYLASFGYTGQFLSPILFGVVLVFGDVGWVFVAAGTLTAISALAFGSRVLRPA
ncbi:MFS transporter [Salinibaculum rarum]|uniref:MFS transporter n=1 Tax=Salinibaculum rarum TaxID=3058903 RepID=UPI00265F181A|nr:MFS transporter [Salinibaculum sp. KK48]